MITLNLNPEIEAGLLAQAEASGLSLEEFVASLVGRARSPVQKPLSPKERAAGFDAWANGHRVTPPLSDQAISRESIYEHRGL